ncbi:hypothetical protein BBAD15_g6491 [Beauveria bassiana D1-5]|uniref:Uncharacterized protein n=1 Tax=Beauveria bassiana D1-5 TaxID=1245745 RepID=A0A0A2VPY4_BEABA|nr:hypothetical protein BBAD15_g6491 [Beauveria bassiana D1-5]
MRCLVLLPVVFCSLAQAQGFIAATLYSDTGYEFDVPRFDQLEVGNSNVCFVYRDLNCIDEVKRFLAGEHEISDLDFKSIKCEGTLETMTEEQS